MNPWYNFLEGVQCAAGSEEVSVEAAKPDWSNSLGQGQTELGVAAISCHQLIHEKPSPNYFCPYCSEKPALTHVSYLYHCSSPSSVFPLSCTLRG